MNSQAANHRVTRPERGALAALVVLAGIATTGLAQAQSFNSGSTGADGAFNLTSTASGTTVEFDPDVLGFDPEDDNVFHFTTITIPSGVTVHLSAKYTNGPVYWLATGAVEIAGIVDLNGAAGSARTASTVTRVAAIPGPGGYPGGLGGGYWTGAPGAALPGLGAGGGAAGVSGRSGRGTGGTFTGNEFLVPLLGGSGGGGGSDGTYEWWGGGGGAGGGALLIASSVSINVAGQIRANGGYGGAGSSGNCAGYYCYFNGGSGSGGAIRMATPLLQGNGTLSVAGGAQVALDSPNGSAAAGRIRLEAYQHNWTYSIVGNYTTGSPLNSFAPTTPPPSIRVIGVGGMSVPPKPSGSFDLPDVVINSSAPINVLIEGRYIPPGTTVTLQLFSLDGADQTITTAPLQGTLAQTTTSASVTLPFGFSRGYARAVWQ